MRAATISSALSVYRILYLVRQREADERQRDGTGRLGYAGRRIGHGAERHDANGIRRSRAPRSRSYMITATLRRRSLHGLYSSDLWDLFL